MTSIGLILFSIIRLFSLLLIVRILIEMVQSFSKDFRPPRWFSIAAEPIFVVTDPPVKLLRKVIPPLPMGGVSLDVSVIALFFILSILGALVQVVFL